MIMPFTIALVIAVLMIVQTFDLLAFHESTTNAGLLPVAPAPGEPHGYVVDGDGIQMKKAGKVMAMLFQTAAIANFVQARMGPQDDIPVLKWTETQTFVRDQTGAMVNPMQNVFSFIKNAILNCDLDHGANAQVANCIYMVSDQNPLLFFGERPSDLPANARWIVFTGVTAAVANTWTEDTPTTTFNFSVDKKYDVYGMRGFSDTGYAFRIHPQDDPTRWRPGWLLGDTNILLQTLYSKSPVFSFSGLTPPTFDKLCSGTDSTVSRYELLCVER